MLKTLTRPVTPRVVGVVLALAALCATAATISIQTATAAPGPPSPPARTGGYVPAHPSKEDNCPQTGCDGPIPLLYNGGPTMTTNTVYTVFWSPSSNPIPASYVSTINQYFQDVAHDSGMPTNVYASDTQYSGIQYSSTFGGTYTLTSAFPANGCGPYGGASVCLTDGQLQAALSSAISTNGWQKTGTNMFFMFTPNNVDSCSGSSCAFTSYCAYHGYGLGGMIYANMPYAKSSLYPGNCDVGQYPNGQDADATINVTSHEHNEAITDPQLNAWYDANGWEDGDKCAWTFGLLSGTGNAHYNQTINGDHYFLQEEWSNDTPNPNPPPATGLCVQTHSIGGGGGSPPTVTSFSPTSGPVGTPVDIQGTNFVNVQSVTFNGVADSSATVNNSGDISAHVPTGATTGKITVTTSNGSGSSATNFTVTSSGSPPVVSSFSPTSGPVGTTVAINGSNFTGATKVTFGGTAASYFVNSSVKITASVPAGAVTGKIAVTTGNGTGTSVSNFTVTGGGGGGGAPTITGFSPTSGFQGQTVVITGTNFTGATSVRLGNATASFTVNSSTQITATVPREFFLGSYKWVVTTPAGTAASTTYFRYL
jgi:hypothetical protein